jgi:hypothetical protein
VEAITPDGTSAKAMQRIRHDPQAKGAVEPAPQPIVDSVLPRNILLGLERDEVAVVIRAGTTLPTAGEIHDQFSCHANQYPFTLQGPVYEGRDREHEIPYGPFNTYMGLLTVSCPPTPTPTKIVIAYEVDESQKITMKCWFEHDPSVFGKVELKPHDISPDKLHLIERTERTINQLGERVRPEEKARVNRKKQALIDLCEQYDVDHTEETRNRVIQTGKELQEELKGLEQKYRL